MTAAQEEQTPERKNENIWTIPNILTILRLVSIPVFIFLLLQKEFTSRFIAFTLFALASITDLVDGYIARRFKQESELGKFMDPLADKALVVAAFLTFLFLSEQVQLWMVAIIISRDMLITALRWLAIRQGASLRTSVFGKVKTAFQMFCITMILISFLAISHRERDTINAMYSTAFEEEGRGAFAVATEAMLKFFADGSERVLFDLASFSPLLSHAVYDDCYCHLRAALSHYELSLAVAPVHAARRDPGLNTRSLCLPKS